MSPAALDRGLRTAYEEPKAAGKKLEELIAGEGALRAAEVLERSPVRLGELRGVGLGGLRSAARREAVSGAAELGRELREAAARQARLREDESGGDRHRGAGDGGEGKGTAIVAGARPAAALAASRGRHGARGGGARRAADQAASAGGDRRQAGWASAPCGARAGAGSRGRSLAGSLASRRLPESILASLLADGTGGRSSGGPAPALS